ncbi:MAG: DUF4397 domain-containing protein [Gemmatimonas sp.]
MIKLRTIAMALCAIAMTACEKNAVQDITGTVPGARIRFFNFGLGAPGVNFYANDAKLTGALSATGTESVTGTIYGGVGTAGLYSAVNPGAYTLTGRISATVDKDLVVSTVTSTLADGKYYSYFQSGPYDPTTKKTDAFVVEDPFIDSFDYTVAYVRFVNAIHNSSPMTLYIKPISPSTDPERAVGGLVAYKSAGAFTAVPPGTYDLSTRVAGASTFAISRTQVGFSAGRVYTIGARGDMTITSTTATTRPFLDNTANR